MRGVCNQNIISYISWSSFRNLVNEQVSEYLVLSK